MRHIGIVYRLEGSETFVDFAAFYDDFVEDTPEKERENIMLGTVIVPYDKGEEWDSSELHKFLKNQVIDKT